MEGVYRFLLTPRWWGINVFFGPLVGATLLLVLNDFVTKVTEHYSLVLGVIILIFALGLRIAARLSRPRAVQPATAN